MMLNFFRKIMCLMKLNLITTALCMHRTSWADNGYVISSLRQPCSLSLGFLQRSWQCMLPLVVKVIYVNSLVNQKWLSFVIRMFLKENDLGVQIFKVLQMKRS